MTTLESVPRVFPWDPKGPPCPLFRDPDVWIAAFSTPQSRRVLKKAVKKAGRKGVISVGDDKKVGDLSVWMIENLERRQLLRRILRQYLGPDLHSLLWRQFYIENNKVSEAFPSSRIHHEDEQGRYLLNPEGLEQLLEEVRPVDEVLQDVAIVACAFAILQPELQAKILQILLNYDENLCELLLPPQTPAVIDETPIEDIGEEPTASEEEEPFEEESGIVTEETEFTKPLKITRSWLQEGRRQIEILLKAHKNLEASAGELQSEFLNFSLTEPDETIRKCESAGEQVAKVAIAAGGLDSWIDEWTEPIAQLIRSSDFDLPKEFVSIHSLFREPRSTSAEMLSIALKLHEKIENLSSELTDLAASLQELVSKIHKLEEALDQKTVTISEQIPPDDFVDGLGLHQSLSEHHSILRKQLAEALERRKQSCLTELKNVDPRIPEENPELKTEIDAIESCLNGSRSQNDIATCEASMERLLDKIASITLAPNLTGLVAHALENGALPHSVCPIARHLLSRGRSEEAALVLLLLQTAHEPEAVEVDLEEFSSLFLESCARLGLNPAIDSNWPLIFFNSPWIKGLTRADIDDSNLLNRLFVSYLVLHRVGDLNSHLNQFFELGFHEERFPSKFSILTRLQQCIVNHQGFTIVDESNRSKLDESRLTVEAFFRRHESGDYVRQTAHGNEVAEAERDFVFPALEKLFGKVDKLCREGSFDEAKIKAQSVEQISKTAFRDASVSSTESSYYKRQIYGQQQGYIPAFQRLVIDFINTYQSWRKKNPNPNNTFTPSKVSNELEKLAGESFDTVFWSQVEAGLTQNPSVELDLETNAPELIAVLLNHCPTAIARVPRLVTTYCAVGPNFSPDSKAILEAIESLPQPIDQSLINKFEKHNCLHHAQLLEGLIAHNDDTVYNPDSQKRSVANAQLREQLMERLSKIVKDDRNDSSNNAISMAVERGQYTYAGNRIAKIEGAMKADHAEKQKQLLEKIDQLQEIVTSVENELTGSDANDVWLEEIFEFTSLIARKLKLGRHAIQRDASQLPDLDELHQIVDALQFVVKTRSDHFQELETLLRTAPFSIQVEKKEGTENNALLEAEPQFQKLWEHLERTNSVNEDNARSIANTWAELAKEFSRLSGMYHDLHQTLKYADVPEYTFGRYDTRFYDPISGWLDRTVSLYLALKSDDWKDLWTRLKAYLDGAKDDTLKVIIVPTGADELRDRWKYKPKFDNFVIVDRATAGKICRSSSIGAPLRQILHQSAPRLSHIGLFRTEGWVHKSKNLFVGREEALQQLSHQPSSAIWGGRRIGKTSLLQALKHRLENTPRSGPIQVVYIYADIGGDDPDLILAGQIAKSLGLNLPTTVHDLKSSVIELCREYGVTILIDEVDRYIEASRRVHGPTEFPLARALRGIAQSSTEGRFRLVYAGFKQLFYEVKLRPNSDTADPFKNFLEPVTKDFGDFRPEQVDQLLSKAFREMLGIDYEPDVPRLVKERTSGHPAFVQALGLRLLDAIDSRHSAGSNKKIEAYHIEDVYNESPDSFGDREAYIDYVHETLGLNLSHLERAIMLAVSIDITARNAPLSTPYTAPEIATSVSEWAANAPPPDCSDFKNALKFLAMTNMLTMREKNRNVEYEISYPSYIEIMNRLGDLNRIEVASSIEQYCKMEEGRII